MDERHPHFKLQAETVKELVKDVKAGATQAEVAERYGVSKTTVSLIMSGQRWGWLTGIKRQPWLS